VVTLTTLSYIHAIIWICTIVIALTTLCFRVTTWLTVRFRLGNYKNSSQTAFDTWIAKTHMVGSVIITFTTFGLGYALKRVTAIVIFWTTI
jgi:hypothetical protein